MLNVNGSHFQALEQTLGAAVLRHKVISNNIANVDTPKFKRSHVVFEELLRKQMGSTKQLDGRRTDPRHIYIGAGGRDVNPKIVIDEKTVMNNNLNNVDIDQEMANLAKNQLFYNTVIHQVTHEIRMAKTAMEARS